MIVRNEMVVWLQLAMRYVWMKIEIDRNNSNNIARQIQNKLSSRHPFLDFSVGIALSIEA